MNKNGKLSALAFDPELTPGRAQRGERLSSDSSRPKK